jgi:hypothetical protein
MKRAAAVGAVWVIATLASAQDSTDDQALLAAIQSQARQNLDHLPDYICEQSVERHRQDAPDEPFLSVDTLRVEVGLIGDRELFAWPDSDRFEEEELADLIQHGTVGSGNFGLHARNVFTTSGPDFTYRGEEELEGRKVHRYDFDVPLQRSSYHLRVQPLQARVPFHGSFWADVETLDLVRLEVIADDIPQELGLVVATDRMDYARAAIGTSEFLLPKGSELNMVGVGGIASRNFTKFSGCRQYVGESSISFHAPSAGGDHQASRGGDLRLPPRVNLELSLVDEIDSRNAVIGSPVRAVLAKPLKDGEEILIPKGASVLGRLVRMEKYQNPVDHFVVGLEFHTVEFDGRQAGFTATMREASGSSSLMKQAKSLDPKFTKRRKPSMNILVNETQRGQGTLYWKANKPVIQPGLKMRWVTESER